MNDNATTTKPTMPNAWPGLMQTAMTTERTVTDGAHMTELVDMLHEISANHPATLAAMQEMRDRDRSLMADLWRDNYENVLGWLVFYARQVRNEQREIVAALTE